MQLQIIMNRVQAGVSWQMPLERGLRKMGFRIVIRKNKVFELLSVLVTVKNC